MKGGRNVSKNVEAIQYVIITRGKQTRVSRGMMRAARRAFFVAAKLAGNALPGPKLWVSRWRLTRCGNPKK